MIEQQLQLLSVQTQPYQARKFIYNNVWISSIRSGGAAFRENALYPDLLRVLRNASNLACSSEEISRERLCLVLYLSLLRM